MKYNHKKLSITVKQTVPGIKRGIKGFEIVDLVALVVIDWVQIDDITWKLGRPACNEGSLDHILNIQLPVSR